MVKNLYFEARGSALKIYCHLFGQLVFLFSLVDLKREASVQLLYFCISRIEKIVNELTVLTSHTSSKFTFSI
jgi:hypothetical protein